MSQSEGARRVAPSIPAAPGPPRTSQTLQREDLGVLAGGIVAGLLAIHPRLRALGEPPRTPSPLPSPRPWGPSPWRQVGREGPPPCLVDRDWRLVSEGRYVTWADLCTRLTRGPLAFAWIGDQDGPGLFEDSPRISPGLLLRRPNGSWRAASLLCPYDKSPVIYDESEDLWSCRSCGSAFHGVFGWVRRTPAQKPLLTFLVREEPPHGRVLLRPPWVRRER
jgi:hypothetical protein